MELVNKFTNPGIVFLVTVALGIWLSLAGKPYHGILFNIHKLVALGAVIATLVQTSKVFRETGVEALPLLFVIAAVACAVALFVSGALMSMQKFSYEASLATHRITPILAALAMLAALAFLRAGK